MVVRMCIDQKSSYVVLYRGIKLWDCIRESVQWSTTKVKFKAQIKGIKL